MERHCLKCDKELEAAFGEGDDYPPSEAVIFYAQGNYGSTVFDPMDGSSLKIYICDDCLSKAADKVALVKDDDTLAWHVD